MKKTVENVIEYLVDKELRFGCGIKILRFCDDGDADYFWGKFTGDTSIAGKNYLSVTDSDGDVEDTYGWKYEILGNPILLGDVLAKIDFGKSELLYNWEKCGFNKSLQQIIEDSGWEVEIVHSDNCFSMEMLECDCIPESGYTRLKDQNARKLFEFLAEVFKGEL